MSINKRQRHGSHVPVLERIPQFFTIKTVIEFGCGKFSTPTFMNKSIYPDLENLFSYETNPNWLKLVHAIFKDDKRLRIKLIPDNVNKIKRNLDTFPVDLVFVDGVRSHRAYILKNLKFLSDLIVLHDAECRRKRYLRAKVKSFKYRYFYTPPNCSMRGKTVILSNKIKVDSINWNIKWHRDWLAAAEKLI